LAALGGVSVFSGLAPLPLIARQALFGPQDPAAGHQLSPAQPLEPERVARLAPDAIHVPVSVANKMGLRTAAVTGVQAPIRLPSFQGVLALDNDRLSRVHARFAGEVVELGRIAEGSGPTLHVGDRVCQGDLLAVIWSTELGKKKSELVDALAKLRAEVQLRDRLKKLFDEGAGAGRTYRDAEKDVQARRVEIASLERTLRTWRVTDEDIEDIRAEVEHLADGTTPAIKSGDWARVEVRAPIEGVILEKNAIVGDIVDTDADLFKIGDLSSMIVWAHVYEEDLPLLESLPRPTPWTLKLPSRPEAIFAGTLDKIGAVIDPAQHTALVSGRVQNPWEELKVGQFVTATVSLPPPENELELPATAVVEDGRESVVFVQPKPRENIFVRRPVQVVRRLRETVYVTKSEAGLHAGDKVVVAGSLMLQNAMVHLPPARDPSAEALASLHARRRKVETGE
jgi:cobalt-zinc-cadmium efflux system membrane fusion protein